MSIRTEKIASTIQHELAPLLLEHLDESHYGLITITNVVVLEDLTEARIFVRVLEKPKRFFAEIRKVLPKIIKDFNKRMTMKRTPRLVFLPDAKFDNNNQLLNKIDSL
jgi:ribosome-binding factor A